MLDFAQEKGSTAGAERKSSKQGAVGAEKKKQEEVKMHVNSTSSKSSRAPTKVDDAPDADEIRVAELKRHHKSVNERLR